MREIASASVSGNAWKLHEVHFMAVLANIAITIMQNRLG